jgi:hypothetical protein
VIEVSPGHMCMPMELGKKWDLPGNMSMVACMVEDTSDSDLVSLEPNEISNLRKWCMMVFAGCADYMMFGSICKLCHTPRVWLVFSCSCCIVLLHDAVCCAVLEPKFLSSLSNVLATKNSSNEEVFCSRGVLMLTGFRFRHEKVDFYIYG